MKVFSIRVRSAFMDLPHEKTILQLGLKKNELSKRIRGRIHLLNKYIDLAMVRGKFEEEEENLFAFSNRISQEVLAFKSIKL